MTYYSGSVQKGRKKARKQESKKARKEERIFDTCTRLISQGYDKYPRV